MGNFRCNFRRHQARGKGEPLLIVGMIDAVANKFPVDLTRGQRFLTCLTFPVYVGGLSAGGAMSVIMAVTYPDIFAACAVGAGLVFLGVFLSEILRIGMEGCHFCRERLHCHVFWFDGILLTLCRWSQSCGTRR